MDLQLVSNTIASIGYLFVLFFGACQFRHSSYHQHHLDGRGHHTDRLFDSFGCFHNCCLHLSQFAGFLVTASRVWESRAPRGRWLSRTHLPWLLMWRLFGLRKVESPHPASNVDGQRGELRLTPNLRTAIPAGERSMHRAGAPRLILLSVHVGSVNVLMYSSPDPLSSRQQIAHCSVCCSGAPTAPCSGACCRTASCQPPSK